jgi:hypothetical protein
LDSPTYGSAKSCDLDLHPRVPGLERGQDLRGQLGCGVGLEADDEAAAASVVCGVPGGNGKPFCAGQEAFCLLEQDHPGGRERDAPAVAFEQLGAELVLELADLNAQRGLADMEPDRRAPEVELLGDRHEVAQQAQLRRFGHA